MQSSARTGRILIVANELKHLVRNGGIGTHHWLLADALADAGWSVGILYCGPKTEPLLLDRCCQLLSKKRIDFWHVDSFTLSPLDAGECSVAGPAAERSHQVLQAIDSLSAAIPFDLIEFADWQGCGFRTAQARRLGASLRHTRIIVKLHGSSQWCREGNRIWVANTDELLGDYCERYSFEHADVQLAPCRYMLEYVKSIGWNVRGDAHVLDYPYPQPDFQATTQDFEENPELVFFGRLETRKGLKVFLDAVRQLPLDARVTFLGSETTIDHAPASKLIAQSLAGRSYCIETGFQGAEALAYLSKGNRLAVIPSLMENSPFTVIECAANGLPFIASTVGGIPELLPDEELRKSLLFEPTPAHLAARLRDYLRLGPDIRGELTARLQTHCNVGRNHAKIAEFYAELLPQEQSTLLAAPPARWAASHDTPPSSPSTDMPLVSIAVPFYNLGPYLPETLESVRVQTYENREVFVIDDGSTDPDSLAVWDRMQENYPEFHFVRQKNLGLSGARNTALALASGKYFLPVDADNIAAPEMVSRLVAAFERCPELSALSCYHGAFAETTDIEKESFCYVYRPTGGPFVASCIRNVYGDANAMFRTSALRSIGGYEADQKTGYEDWEVFVKLSKGGHLLDVYPEYLFYYRHREQSMLRTTSTFLNQMRVMRQFYATETLPRAEQIALWSALVGLDEQQRLLNAERWNLRWQVQQLTASLDASLEKKPPPPVPSAFKRVKQFLRRAPYYGVVSATLKQLKQKAA